MPSRKDGSMAKPKSEKVYRPKGVSWEDSLPIRVINGFECFQCPVTKCWLTIAGCERNQQAADNAAYCVKAGVEIYKMDEIYMKRLSECCACDMYKTLSKEEFMVYIKAAIKKYTELFDSIKTDFEESAYETKRLQWREWYWREKRKERKK